MAVVTSLLREQLDFDYVIVGGGTAGCIIASRLAEALPDKKTLLIEAGPSDMDDTKVLDLRNMYNLMGSEYDFCYKSVEQPLGNKRQLALREAVTN